MVAKVARRSLVGLESTREVLGLGGEYLGLDSQPCSEYSAFEILFYNNGYKQTTRKYFHPQNR
ncbi:hypothetical protein HanRHA438_Chr01g0043821 [Helianthus annuus]|nr:hypothetical protein HanRHA438_Chr01g0043821 [Helianthus annuus]